MTFPLKMALLALAMVCIQAPRARAGVFNIPRFVPQGEFAFGLEPEAILDGPSDDDSGVGLNAKYTAGLSDQIDGQVVLGTGSGSRRFRVGGNLALDLFPDLPKQPGIGLAIHGLYYNLREGHETELQLIPYLHKSFHLQGSSHPKEAKRSAASTVKKSKVSSKKAETYDANESEEQADDEEGEGMAVDPFVAFPFGYAFSGGRYRAVSTLSIGANFELSEHFSTILEFGMPVNNTQTVFSGGLVYTH